LQYRHRASPYLGEKLVGRVTETYLRGALVYADGQFLGKPRGKECRDE
jgi:allantoinase